MIPEQTWGLAGEITAIVVVVLFGLYFGYIFFFKKKLNPEKWSGMKKD